MSATLPAGCGCPTPVVVSVPGTSGADGAAGENSYTTVSEDFVVPAIAESVSVAVVSSAWVAIGQNIFIFGAGYFNVNSNTSNVIGLTYLDYAGNTAAGQTVSAGSKVSPGGTQPPFAYPITIALGGTGAATKSEAQASLGLGQDLTSSVSTGFQQHITATAAVISGISVTAPAAGKYLVLGSVTVELDSAVFASDEKILIESVNITQISVINSAYRNTGNVMPQYAPQYSMSADYVVPFSQVTLAANDVVSLRASVSNLPSRGDANITAANLSLVPISLT